MSPQPPASPAAALGLQRPTPLSFCDRPPPGPCPRGSGLGWLWPQEQTWDRHRRKSEQGAGLPPSPQPRAPAPFPAEETQADTGQALLEGVSKGQALPLGTSEAKGPGPALGVGEPGVGSPGEGPCTGHHSSLLPLFHIYSLRSGRLVTLPLAGWQSRCAGHSPLTNVAVSPCG